MQNLKFQLKIQNLTPLQAFESLYNGFGSFLLESPTGTGKLERYSFIGINPTQVITDFNTLKNADPKYGAFGFISYDFGREIEELPDLAKDDLKIPRLMFVVPETLVVFDHLKNEVEVFAEDTNVVHEIRNRVLDIDAGMDVRYRKIEVGIFQPPVSTSYFYTGLLTQNLTSNLTQSQFESIVRKAKEYISAGDIYQVNLSQRFETKLNEDPFHIYKRLRQINPSPFASFFDFGDLKLVSCSPERLVKLENGIAETRPIAGTRPITAKPDKLLLDPKERAEHIMLVDLERNDLGKVCEYGSVRVDENMIIEKYSHVYHIVSNVVGKLRKDCDKFDLIKAMFPGGTITGCPKIRSMEIIEELEPVKRGSYTGCMGYILPDKIDLNIAIRTIVVKNDTAYIQVGAGIVADSIPEWEYHETLHKAQAMLEALT